MAHEGMTICEAEGDDGHTARTARSYHTSAGNLVRNSRAGRRLARELYPIRHVSLNEYRATHTSEVEAALLLIGEYIIHRRWYNEASDTNQSYSREVHRLSLRVHGSGQAVPDHRLYTVPLQDGKESHYGGAG